MIGGKPSKKNSKRRNRKRKRSMKGELTSNDLPGDLMAKKRMSSSSQGTEMEGEEVSNNLPDDVLAKVRMLSTCKATETEGQEVSKELPEDLLETMRTLSSGKTTETEEEMMNKDFPEHLVETIISKLPFPHIFKARALSRAWLARLSSISSHDDEMNRGLATSFQNLVRESSHNWETFCPVWFGHDSHSLSTYKTTSEKDFRDNSFAYDQGSGTWRSLPSLSFLTRDVNLETRKYLEIEGALLYGHARLNRGYFGLIVANILTKSWKILPPPNNAHEHRPIVWMKLVSDTLLGYKMITVSRYHGDDCRVSAQVYNSNSDAWTSKEIDILTGFDARAGFESRTVAYLNGVVYIMSNYVRRGSYFSTFAFSVEEGTVEVVNVSLIGVEDDHNIRGQSDLVPCNSTLMLIVSQGVTTLRVFKVDLKSRRLLLVARIPHALQAAWRACKLFNAGDCIFFREGHIYYKDVGFNHRIDAVVMLRRSCLRDRVLTYNVVKSEWSCFEVPKVTERRDRREDEWRTEDKWTEDEWSTSCFQPGRNPFMEV